MANYDWKINTSQWLVPNVWRWHDAFTNHLISSGSVALTFGLVTLQAESGTADDLDSITGGVLGNEIIVTADSGDTITLKHATGTDTIALASGADLAISAGDFVRLLHNGTQWYEFTSSGSGGGGATDISVFAYLNSLQNISNATYTSVQWDAEVFDTDTMHDNSTNPERITFTTAGKYQVNCLLTLNDTGTTGRREAWIYHKQGATTVASYRIRSSASVGDGTYQLLQFNGIIDASAGDYVYVEYYQNSGTSKNLSGKSGSTYFNMIQAHKIS